MLYLIPIAAFVIVLDRLTKWLVLQNMTGGREIKILPGILHLNLVLNRGAAFGLFDGMAPFLILASIAAISCIILYVSNKRAPDKVLSVGLAMILGGAAGNLIDRLFYGHVVDFIDLRVWPVFNVADSFITIGAVVLGSRIILNQKSKG